MFKDIRAGMTINIVPATTLLQRQMNVRVMGTCGYELAESYDDIAARHANIFTTLTDKDIPNDVWSYEYLIFRGPDGKPQAWPDAWIDNITVVEKIRARIQTEHSSLDEIEKLRNYLDSRAIPYTIEVEN